MNEITTRTLYKNYENLCRNINTVDVANDHWIIKKNTQSLKCLDRW